MKIINLGFACLISMSCFASGFRIPEQSGDGVALATSNIAKSFGADAAYYNPANMVFLPNEHLMTMSNSYFHAGVQKFKNKSNRFGKLNYDTNSKDGNFYVPGFHFVAPFYDNFRFGFSVASPAGISVRWDDSYPRALAEIFQIKIAEINPSIAYQINDKLSVGFGLRAVYTQAKAINNLKFSVAPGINAQARRKLEGDSLNFGYNLALTYKPIEDLSLSATYRSKVDMKIKGDADINVGLDVMGRSLRQKYKGGSNVTIPLPATLTLASAYEYNDFTFMFAYDRIFWSSLKNLDFDYDGKVPLEAMFDDPIEKNWKDSDAYRFGVAYQYNPKLRLMAGIAYDEATVDSNKVKFELPDTHSFVYSAGANYEINDNLSLGLSYLYQDRKKRRVNSKDKFIAFNNVDGEFDRNYISILNLSIDYRF